MTKICTRCRKNIFPPGSAVMVGGSYYHRKHLFCDHCGVVLSPDSDVIKHDDMLYCKEDYLELFAQKCTYCNQPIEVRYFYLFSNNMLEWLSHAQHFRFFLEPGHIRFGEALSPRALFVCSMWRTDHWKVCTVLFQSEIQSFDF